MITRRLYTEDVNAIYTVADKVNNNVAVNVFRLSPSQSKALENRKLRAAISINAPSMHQPGKKRLMTPRMVEAAATLSYIGFTQNEIGEMFNCNNRTVSEHLMKYSGWCKGGF